MYLNTALGFGQQKSSVTILFHLFNDSNTYKLDVESWWKRKRETQVLDNVFVGNLRGMF